jgi:hypothetical protein
MVNISIQFNASPECQEVIDWLIAHNYPALPVAPAQSPWKYHKVVQTHREQDVWAYCPLNPATLQPIPLFTGKNPSYLDATGCPHLVNHRPYQKRLPYNHELKLWFANPSNGVGTLGGWNDTVWLDFDVKQFPDEQECDAAVLKILERLGRYQAGTSEHSTAASSLRSSLGASPTNQPTPSDDAHPPRYQTFIERTHSGGWRIAVKVKQKPNFTNFSLTPGGSHVGEALYTGRFTVLAPTIGSSGKPYVSLSRLEPLQVESLESMGIYSTKGGLGIGNSQPVGKSCTTPVPDLQSSVPIPGSIPLELLGCETATQILHGNCPTGDRSEALATATQEWYGWQNWASDNGIPISGNATTLVHHAGSLLGLECDRINRILKTIDPTACQPAALYRGGEESCWKKVYHLSKATFEAKCPPHIKSVITTEWGHGSGNGGGSGGGRRGGGGKERGDGGDDSNGDDNTSEAFLHQVASARKPFASTLPLDMKAIHSQIEDILIQDLPPSELQTAKIRIRTNNPGLSEREISRLFETIEQELELKETRSDRRSEVDNLLKLGDQSLNLSDFLPDDLAQPLKELSAGLNIRPEVCLTFLLVAASSLHKTTTELVIHKGQSFSVPPTIFAGLVSESGQKKSPLLKAIINKPLSILQRAKREAYSQALLKYEKEIAEWDKCSMTERSSKFPDGKPKLPSQQLYYFTNATGEGILYQFQAHPDKALLALFDELAGLFASQNKYSGGRGSDRQDILSAFDGTGATVLRASGAKADIDGLLLSICGTIQPEVLKQLMRDARDPDGQWARFLFVNQPLAAATLKDDDGSGIDLCDRLLDYYRTIDQLPAMEYRLSREAFSRYQPVYNQLERLRVSHPNPGMRAVYSKMEGYIGRLALNLHVLHELSAGKTIPSNEIGLSTIERAIALSKFYIGQVELIHANLVQDLSDIAPHLVRVVELSKRMDALSGDSWIKAKIVQSGYDSRHRPRPDEIRSWFRELEALGIGTTRGSGIRLEYSWKLSDLPMNRGGIGETGGAPGPLLNPDSDKDSSSSSRTTVPTLLQGTDDPQHKVEKSGEKWITSPPTEPTLNQGSSEKVEKVDNPTPLPQVEVGSMCQKQGALSSGSFTAAAKEQQHNARAHEHLGVARGEPTNPLQHSSRTLQTVVSEESSSRSQGGVASRAGGEEQPEGLAESSSLLSRSNTTSPAPKVVPPTKILKGIIHSTSPLSGCDDGVASSEAVDTISTFSPPRESLSTFEDSREPKGKIPHLEAAARAVSLERDEGEKMKDEKRSVQTSVESLEPAREGVVLRVSREHQRQEPIDDAHVDAGVEPSGTSVQEKVVLSVTAPSQHLGSSPRYARVLVTVEESVGSKGLQETELLAIVMVVSILRTGSFLVEWFDELPSPPVTAERASCQHPAESIELDVEPPAMPEPDDPASLTAVCATGAAPEELATIASDAEVDRLQVGVSAWLLKSASAAKRDVGKHSYTVGDRVYWANCPGHCEQFAPFEITAIDGDYAKLDLFEKPVLLAELHPISFGDDPSD